MVKPVVGPGQVGSDGSPDARLAEVVDVARRHEDRLESVRANRRWWDATAASYQAEHGAFLGDARFVWGPEGLAESDARLLGPDRTLRGARVLEVGCGAAQCSRWLTTRGARAVGVDVSSGQLRQARALDRRTGVAVPVVQTDAQALPFDAESFDLACSAYGAIPFVADSATVMREVARVIRPGGRWVFSVTHPFRWCFADDPGPAGLVARDSYFDRRAYVEVDEGGRAVYAEHHRTIGDRVREIAAAGLVLTDLVEPEWPAGHTRAWGQWSPLRGRILPGTAVYCCVKPVTSDR